MSNTNVFRALAIEGGGMRCIYTSAYLNKLFQQPISNSKGPNDELDVGKAFDLIAGTSSGAFIACGLASGISVSVIAESIRNMGKKVFPKQIPDMKSACWMQYISLLWDFFWRKASLREGEKALKAELEKLFGNQTLGGLWSKRKIALAITAINMATHRAWVFKTPHIETKTRDNGYTLADVCMASSAAPIFRSLANIYDTDVNSPRTFKTFVDGGLAANNPILVALWDALELTDENQEIEIYCLSSNSPNNGDVILENQNYWSYKEWKFGSKVVDVALNAQNSLHIEMAKLFVKHLKRQVHIVEFPTTHFSVDISSKVKLDSHDEVVALALKQHAESDVDKIHQMMHKKDNENGMRIKGLLNSVKKMTSSNS